MSKTENCIAKTKTWLSAIFCSLALSGCGFQLAGTAPGVGMSGKMDGAYVVSRVGIDQLIDQPVAEQIHTDLASISQQVFDRAQADMPGILIVNEENIERGVTLSQDLFERQIDLEKRVEFQLLDSAGTILVADSIRVSREFIDDPVNPSAKQAEREILIRSINRDLSRQIIYRLHMLLAESSNSQAAPE